MQYKKVITSSILVAFVVAIVNELVFAAENIVTQDVILDGVLNILVLIQKYSWPFVTLLMIYALYKYYVIGSEVLADKIKVNKWLLVFLYLWYFYNVHH